MCCVVTDTSAQRGNRASEDIRRTVKALSYSLKSHSKCLLISRACASCRYLQCAFSLLALKTTAPFDTASPFLLVVPLVPQVHLAEDVCW